MEEKLLEIKNLSVNYKNDEQIVHAINGISLQLTRGRTLGLVGETGAGKTTTALAIMRLLPERSANITGGEILFEGKDLLLAKEKELQKIRGDKISMIFQDPMTALNPVKTIGDQIEEAIILHGENLSGTQVSEKVDEVLQMVGISPQRRGDYPLQFSGGMKQRVVIAIALACRPALLLADEPTTALDVTIQAQVLAMINDLKEKLGTSVIMITHDFGIVAQTCDDVAVMYAGEIIEMGTLEDIFLENRGHHPYTTSLFEAIPSLKKESRRLHPIDGLMPDPTDLPVGCSFSPRCPMCTERCRTEKPMQHKKGTHMIACHFAEGSE